MKESHADSLSSRLIQLTAELQSVEAELRSAQNPDPAILQNFRRSVDEVRTTAWTIGELMNARAIRKNPQVVLSFLAAERMRRFSEMVRGLAVDMDDPVVTWEANGVRKVAESLDLLQGRLRRLLNQRQTSIQQVRDAGD